MNNEIVITPNFKKEAKPLLKKYPSLKSELLALEQQLVTEPFNGTPLGGDTFKIRLAVRSKGKGKSGGMRVITYVDLNVALENLRQIFLLSIYDKSETGSIAKEDIQRLIRGLKG
jgi:mRNA-degrading endonuclease RelE of RelBE toxin-antitoxin system